MKRCSYYASECRIISKCNMYCAQYLFGFKDIVSPFGHIICPYAKFSDIPEVVIFLELCLQLLAYGSFPLTFLTSPFSILTITGDVSLAVGAHSITIVPSVVPSTGATNTSPAGRFPNAPGRLKSPVSAKNIRPFTPIDSSVPPGAEMNIFSAPFKHPVRPSVLFLRTFQSTCIGP